jgi:hypothetical protein
MKRRLKRRKQLVSLTSGYSSLTGLEKEEAPNNKGCYRDILPTNEMCHPISKDTIDEVHNRMKKLFSIHTKNELTKLFATCCCFSLHVEHNFLFFSSLFFLCPSPGKYTMGIVTFSRAESQSSPT